MARELHITYVTEDPKNTFAHSDSSALQLVEGVMRVIGHTTIKITTSTKNVINVVAKMKLDNNPACKGVIVTVRKESNLMNAVRRKLNDKSSNR